MIQRVKLLIQLVLLRNQFFFDKQNIEQKIRVFDEKCLELLFQSQKTDFNTSTADIEN